MSVLYIPVSKYTRKITSSLICESSDTSMLLDFTEKHTLKSWILQNQRIDNGDVFLPASIELKHQRSASNDVTSIEAGFVLEISHTSLRDNTDLQTSKGISHP